MSISDQLIARICLRSMAVFVCVLAYGVWIARAGFRIDRGLSGAAQSAWRLRISCLRAVSALLIGLGAPVYCGAEPSIWLALVFPPGVIAEGPDQAIHPS